MKGLLRKIGIPMLLLAIGTPAAAQDQLLLLTQSNLGYESQTWFYSGHDNGLQQDKIKANWDEDRYITSAAYTTKGWFVTMAKNTGFTGQTYHYATDWPGDWIHRKRSEGYYLTTVASNRTHWFIVLSKGTGYTDQYTISNENWSDSEAHIRKKWNEGFRITQATYTGTRWFIVMSLNSNYDRQGYLWATSKESLREQIRAKWDAGYNLTLLEFGDGEYFAVYSTFKVGNDVDQSYRTASSSPSDFISKQWDDGKDIVYVGGGYETSGNSSENLAANNTPSNTGNTGNPRSWRQQLANGGYCDYTQNADGSYSTLTVIPCTWCHGTKTCSICHGVGGVMGYGGIWYPCSACGGSKACRNCNGQGFTTMAGRIQNGTGIGYDSNGRVHLGAAGGKSGSDNGDKTSTQSDDRSKDYIDIIQYSHSYTGKDDYIYCPICDEVGPRHIHIKKHY